ncbi:MAG TPA: hypothetical protein VHV52_05415 [Gaiellaceae bacterium]|nr:hypothetical protein [Gaiellaceae bacterium]
MDERAVTDLRELAERDSELAERGSRLRALDAEVAAVRARAEAIDAFFAEYPQEEMRRRETVAAADAELERRRAELAAAESAFAAAREDETRERAETAIERGRDHVAVATAGLERARAAAAELERDASALSEELPLLEQRARRAAVEVPDAPEPAAGPSGLVEWASHAHAELFVAAGQLDVQRERVIREANELATMLLGEQTFGATVEHALARVIDMRGGG